MKFLALGLALLGAACVNEPVPRIDQRHTLATDERLPAHDIQSFYSAAQWSNLRDLEYERFVVLAGDVRSDGTVNIRRIRERYPDSEFDLAAMELSRQVALKSATVASHVSPSAEIYCIWFKPSLDGTLLIVFARTSELPPAGSSDKRAMYFKALTWRGAL